MAQHSVVSYFCGCGGLDLGFRGGFTYHGQYFRRNHFKFLAAYDNNKNCIETYNSYFSHHGTVADLKELDPRNVPAADILLGGFPCQDFSISGPLKGLSSERGRLYKVMTRYMLEHQPKIVIGENVLNLSRMQDGKVIQTITNDLIDCGYHVKVWTIFAPDYGIPQGRSRLIFVCVRNDIEGFPKDLIPTFKDEHRSIEWAIGDLEGITDETVPNQSQYFKASLAKRGSGQGDEKSDRNKPAYTIRANPRSRIQFHYALDRRLTVRECARIQTFPDDFVFKHSPTTSISQIGNAVPPVLAHQIAQSVQDFLKHA